MMAKRPDEEFGKRRPVALESAVPVKRSRHVALLLMGTVAVGGGAYALTSGRNCQPRSPGMAAPSSPRTAECSPGGSSSGGHGGSWTRGYFYGGDASSRSSSGPSSEAVSGSVARGGFGSFARAFSAHFSGGG